MKDVKNIEITAWSIAFVLAFGSLAISLSKDIPIYQEEVSKTDQELPKKKNKNHEDIKYMSTAMEEYRAFDKDASTNVYLYQVKDEITNNWVTLDIISKKEYETQPELLKEDGRLVYAGKYDGDIIMGVYQTEIKDASSNWVKIEEYNLFDEAPSETKTKRYIYLGEDIKNKTIKLD